MKQIILTLLLIVISCYFAFGQNKKISGHIYQESMDNLETNSLAKNVDIFLIGDVRNKETYKLKYHSKSGKYKLILTSEELKNYAYLEFVSEQKQSRLITINTIDKKVLDITFEDYRKPQPMKKPAIYLYPTEKREITVVHDFKGKMLNTYPVYKENWKVIAEPSGLLRNLVDNRTYSYLFWDGQCDFPAAHYAYKSGFYINKSETIPFLQNTLSEIGLNDTEINDFIVFWLPYLSENEYNFLHFWINDNIDNHSFLQISPKPETEIVLFMEYKGYQNIETLTKLPKQNLQKIERKGFTVVEWGGGEIQRHTLVE